MLNANNIYDRSCVKKSKREIPSAVVGDFNGDARQDVVLKGYTENSELDLAIISEDTAYIITELFRGSGIRGDPKKSVQWRIQNFDAMGPLWFHPAGSRIEPLEDTPFILKADAYEEIFCEKASTLYYFEDGKFIEVGTSD